MSTAGSRTLARTIRIICVLIIGASVLWFATMFATAGTVCACVHGADQNFVLSMDEHVLMGGRASCVRVKVVKDSALILTVNGHRYEIDYVSPSTLERVNIELTNAAPHASYETGMMRVLWCSE